MTNDVFGIVGTRQAGVFRVERVVAEGGFAVVYAAHHEGFRARVALKCLKVPDAMTEAQRTSFLDRFREEGALLFQLSAVVPAVVRPLHVDALTLEGGRLVPFLALEWLEGEGLDRIIDRRRTQEQPPLDLLSLMDLLQPAAHALAVAHRLPTPEGPVVVIHRDLKPENIFVVNGQSGPAVKILDFGIARTKSLASLDAGRVTQTAALDAFTPGYAAPEQWAPKRYGQVGPWTDVFCLALTMVEALTGRPAISGDLTAMMGTTNDPVRRPTPRAEGADVPDEVEAAFARALAVDPRDRTQSIDAFWGELEEAMGLSPSSLGATPAAPSVRPRSLRPDAPPSSRRAPSSGRPYEAVPLSSRSSADGARSRDLGTPSSRAPGPLGSPFTPPQPIAPYAAHPALTPPQAANARAPSGPRPLGGAPELRRGDLRQPGLGGSPTPRGPVDLPIQPVTIRPPLSSGPPPARGAAAAPPSVRPPSSSPTFDLDDGPGHSSPSARPPARPGLSPVAFELAQPARLDEGGTLAGAERGDPHRGQDLRARMRFPVQLLVAAIAIGAANWGYAQVTGEMVHAASWVAGPLVLIALILAGWRFLQMM